MDIYFFISPGDQVTATPFLSSLTQAKASQRGLWSLPKVQQIPPWEWPHEMEKSRGQGFPTDENHCSNRKAFDCGRGGYSSKHYCKEMSSCEEANYYLKYCGLSHLDGDGDGVPCGSLCK